jgi:ferredoxin
MNIAPILHTLVTGGVVTLAFGFMILALGRISAMINTGTRDETHVDHPGSRAAMVLSIVLGHKKTLEDRVAGILHMAFIYGFFVLAIGHTELVIEGLTMFLKSFGMEPILYERFPFMSPHHPLIMAYHFSQDLFAFFVLAAVIYALYRRITGQVKRLQPRSGDAELILYFIGFLYVTFFALTGTGRLIENGGAWHFSWYQPFSSIAARLFLSVDKATIQSIHNVAWWAHLYTFLLFGCYIPLSKHMHLIFAGPNTYFFQKGAYAWRQPEVAAAERKKAAATRARAMGLPQKIDFADESITKYGADRITDLPWKTLLDGFACTECGRCNDVCPAHLTSKPLKPKKVLHDLKVNLLKKNGPDLLGRSPPTKKQKKRSSCFRSSTKTRSTTTTRCRCARSTATTCKWTVKSTLTKRGAARRVAPASKRAPCSSTACPERSLAFAKRW